MASPTRTGRNGEELGPRGSGRNGRGGEGSAPFGRRGPLAFTSPDVGGGGDLRRHLFGDSPAGGRGGRGGGRGGRGGPPHGASPADGGGGGGHPLFAGSPVAAGGAGGGGIALAFGGLPAAAGGASALLPPTPTPKKEELPENSYSVNYDDPPIQIYDDKDCMFEGRYLVVKNATNMNPYEGLVQQIIQAHPTLHEGDFAPGAARPGVYTYLVAYSRNAEDKAEEKVPHLFAKEVKSVLEIGTRHLCIARDASLGIYAVVCGGEILVNDAGQVSWNLLSGAYTKPLLERGGVYNAEVSAARTPKMVETVSALLPSATYVPVPDEVSMAQSVAFIKPENIRHPLSVADLNLYVENGLSVFLFPSAESARRFQREYKEILAVRDIIPSEIARLAVDVGKAVEHLPGRAIAVVAAAEAAAGGLFGGAGDGERRRKTRKGRKGRKGRKAATRRQRQRR